MPASIHCKVSWVELAHLLFGLRPHELGCCLGSAYIHGRKRNWRGMISEKMTIFDHQEKNIEY